MAPKSQKEEIEELKAQVLALQTALRTPTPSENDAKTTYIQAKLPPITLVEPKLDGKSTYRTWSIQIEAIALSIETIWDIIKNGTTVAPASHQQYARSLLLLNMVPTLQMEMSEKTTAYEIWTYLKEQFDTNEFADLAIAVRKLRKSQWDRNEERTIEEFYQEFKTCRMTIKEVSGKELPDLVCTSILLCAIEKEYPNFAMNIEAQLSNPSVPSNQKTFEYTFGRFRTEHYRRMARQEEEQTEDETDSGVHAVVSVCPICSRPHRRGCWVRNPELSPLDVRDKYKRKHEEWKTKTIAGAISTKAEATQLTMN